MGFDRTSFLCLARPFDGTPQSQPAVRQYLAGNTGGRPSWGPGSQVDFGASVSLAVTLCISTIFCHCHEEWRVDYNYDYCHHFYFHSSLSSTIDSALT